MNHLNTGYTGGIPNNLYDRYYSQDIIRDFWYTNGEIGKAIFQLMGGSNAILSGLIVSQGAGHTLSITTGKALVQYSVTIPNSFSGIPPTTQAEDVSIIVDYPGETNIALSGTVNDNTTPNYVHLSYVEADAKSRAKAKTSGSYYYEVSKSYSITVDQTPDSYTGYSVQIAKFTTDGATITFLYNPLYNMRYNPTGLQRTDGYLLNNTSSAVTYEAVPYKTIAAVYPKAFKFSGTFLLGVSGGGTCSPAIRLKNNSSYITSNYSYNIKYATYGAGGTFWASVEATSGSGMVLCPALTNNSWVQFNGTVELLNNVSMWQITVNYYDASTSKPNTWILTGYLGLATMSPPMQAICIYCGSGNTVTLSSNTFRLESIT